MRPVLPHLQTTDYGRQTFPNISCTQANVTFELLELLKSPSWAGEHRWQSKFYSTRF
jgi:hypothetical protein